MLRVTGGELGGRRFKAPAGSDTRPTADKVREALFAILGGRVEVDRSLDLFAGSGALGIEALSRGAERCVFVERRAHVLRVLRGNLADLGLGDRSRVMQADAAYPHKRLMDQGPVELILADPPYERGFVARVATLAGRHGLLAPGGWLAIEHTPAERPEELHGLSLEDRRAYGQTELSLITRR